MPRKSEIQAEEAAVNSPLRRSTRKTSVNSPAPASVATRRTSQTQNETAPRSRRASLSQESSEKDEKVENKPATRGRKASTTKEEPEPKAEPARTRSRRSSAASEPAAEEESKPQVTTRRRRSSATDDIIDLDIAKPVRSLRSSSIEKNTEAETTKKPTRTRRGSVKDDEPKEEPVKRTTRSRRNSVDKAEEVPPKEKKISTRGRRSSTELEGEPEPKAIKLTPVKSRRRLSVTENVNNLEPIEELDTEIKGRNSSSPVIKDAIVNITPIKSSVATEVKGNLNLSVIDETSFIEESQNDKQEGVTTPRRSPRLNKVKSAEKSAGPSSPVSHSIMEDNQSPKEDMKDKKGEDTEELAKSNEGSPQPSPKKLDFTSTEDLPSDLEKDTKDQTVSENPVEVKIPEEEQPKENEDVKSSEDQLQEKTCVNKTLTEVDNCNISMGSDGSFKFHLNVSVASQNESIQETDDLNSSKSSNTSDKENVDANVFSSPKKIATEENNEVLSSLTNIPTEGKNPIQQEVVVARVSNVFRPRMKENSFIEPMEVDEYPSILESEQGGSNIKDAEETSTPHAKENVSDIETQEKLENKNLQKESLVDMDQDSVGDSFYLNLSSNGDCKDEKKDELVNVSKNMKDDEDIQIKTPEKISESEGLIEETDNRLEIVDQEDESSKIKSPVETDNEQIPNEANTTIEIQTKTVELEIEETQDQTVLKTTTITEDIEITCSGPLPTLNKNNELEPHSSQHPKEEEKERGRSSESKRRSNENFKTSIEERRRVKSPSFIHVQFEDSSSKDSSLRKSKSPQPKKEKLLRKSKSPQPQDLPKSKITERETLEECPKKEKLLRKSKSPQPQSLPKSKITEGETLEECSKKEKLLRKSKSPQPQSLPKSKITEGETLEECPKSEEVATKEQSVEKPLLQEQAITEESKNLEVSNEEQINKPSSPKDALGHCDEEPLKKLKNPLIKAKNQENEKKNSLEYLNKQLQLEEVKASALTNIEKELDEEKLDIFNKEEEIDAEECRSSGISDAKGNSQSKISQLKGVFSETDSPSNQNLKIADIEVEVRRSMSPVSKRRSKSPVPQRRSKSPVLARRSNSPVPQRRSKSPVSRRSKSPVLTRRSKSPVPQRRSKSPVSQRRSKSPALLGRSKSPISQTKSKRRSKSPQLDSIVTQELSKSKSVEQTEEEIKNLNMEISECSITECEQSMDLEPRLMQSLDDEEDTGDLPPKESMKSGMADDYDFELPSDEEELEKTHAPEYDQSTVVASYTTTSQLIGDESVSTEMETVILTSKKNSEPTEMEDHPEEENTDILKNDGSPLKSNRPQVNKKNIDKELDNSENEEIFESTEIPQDNIDEEEDECENSQSEVDDKLRKDMDAQKIQDSSQKLEDNNDEKISSIDSAKKVEDLEDELVNYNEKINNSEMKSPQKKLRVRRYSLKKKMESYEEDLEGYDEDSKDSEEENENEMDGPKPMRPRNRSRVVEKDIEKDEMASDEDDAEVVESKTPKKSSKKEKSIQKRRSDEDENIKKQKKRKKSKHIVTEEVKKIEETETNEKKSSKRKKGKSMSPVRPIKSSSSNEDSDLEKNSVSQERKSKKKDKSVSPNISKSTIEKLVKNSPAVILDEYITKKITEMTSDEADAEEEYPEEPNEYISTMAEEGEEDTPSEDSNAIIDEGESIGSTESEYDTDDEYDENDSFICSGEEEQLLSGEEYDLGDEKPKKKKSRIIQLDNYGDEEIIKIQKKEKPKPAEKKKSRIITITDSSESESEEDKVESYNSEEIIKTSETTETQEIVCVEEKTDDDVFIVESKPPTGNLKESPNVSTTESPRLQHTEKKRLSSITIHENINVKDIKDVPLSGRISHIVDSFCTTVYKGEISMNLSIECCAKDGDDTGDEMEKDKNAKKRRLSRSSTGESLGSDEDNMNSERRKVYKPPKRLSVSMDHSDLTEARKRAKKKRKLSKSMDNLDQIETKSKKKKTNKKKKAGKKPKSPVLSEDSLRISSLGLINQLITDIRNRPRRTVRPSTNMNNSWTTELVHVKPSTTAFDKEEKAAYKASKVHPKDFRSKMLNDPSRVRRIDTKALLKKKGVYL